MASPSPICSDASPALDHTCGDDAPGRFGPGTAGAVAAFQEAAGLDVDGTVGPVTWQALVEAGYRLGDRQLYHRSPMTRGDDVAELQRQLGSLGFDAGRVDGIFGPATSAALVEFQRNSGLGPDGIFGPESATALERLGRGRTAATNVAHVREVERLRAAPRHLAGRRVAVGEPGGLGALAAAVGHELRELGAVVALLDHPDGSHQALEANDFGADVYLGLRVTAAGRPPGRLLPDDRLRVHRRSASWPTRCTPRWPTACRARAAKRSAGACRCCGRPACPPCWWPPGLRARSSLRTAGLAQALARALGRWAAAPIPPPPPLAPWTCT